jgi:DHA1 family multidrug resistance protein-like MFS transporter
MERDFIRVCIIRFLMGLSWTMINILLAIYATGFDVAPFFGSIWSVIGAARLLSETPSGILIDRVGTRPCILGGLTAIVGAYLLYATAQTASVALAASALAGSGFAVAGLGLLVQAAADTPTHARVRYMGFLTGSMMASNIVGPTMGGVLADIGGLRTPFLASAVVLGPAVLLTLQLRGQRTAGAPSSGRHILREYWGFIQSRQYLWLFAVAFLSSLLTWGFRSIILPTYGVEVLALTLTRVGILSSMTSVTLFLIQFVVTSRLERALGRRWVFAAGFLLSSSMIIAFSLTTSFVVLIASSGVLGVGLGLITPSLEALWIDITGVHERGRIYGLRIAFFDGGQIVWSLVLPLLMTLSPVLPLYTAAVMAAITLSLLLYACRLDAPGRGCDSR